ncbi:MAG: hypothetical protein ACXWFY_06910 [Chthoniobacterales bacterium]
MASLISQVDALLREFDEGSKNDFLDRIAENYPADLTLLKHLISLAECAEPSLQIAATGLLKRYHLGGAYLPQAAVGRLLDLLAAVEAWESRLHLLQMLAGLEIPQSHAESLCDCLQRFVQDRNKFIRAWAYSGLHRLAELYPEYRAEVAPLLRRASLKEAASVRARLRHLPALKTHSAF